MNVNRYIAKYNFEIARKLKGAQMDVIAPVENQAIFDRFAMLELLHDVSGLLNGGRKYFNRLTLIDGTVIDNEITRIPEDTKIMLVSCSTEENSID